MSMKKLLKIALGTGLVMLDQSDRARKRVRDRVSDHVDDLREFAQDTYETTADRVARASKALRNEDNSTAWNMLRFAVGVGVGIGVGMLIAPEKGDDTRAKLAGKAQEFGDNVRQRFTSANLQAAGD